LGHKTPGIAGGFVFMVYEKGVTETNAEEFLKTIGTGIAPERCDGLQKRNGGTTLRVDTILTAPYPWLSGFVNSFG
jgi:hypothetical protein